MGNSVYKIQWGQQTGHKWGASANSAPVEFPNGQVHWAMSYKDDFGDVWTTSAVTTYYQLRTATGSLKVGPVDKNSVLTSTPFFMDPDFQGGNVGTVNVDGKLKAGSVTGTKVKDVYGQKKTETTELNFLSIPVSSASKSMHPSKLFPMTSYVMLTFTLFSTTAMIQTTFSSILRWAFRSSRVNSIKKLFRLAQSAGRLRTQLVPVTVPQTRHFWEVQNVPM